MMFVGVLNDKRNFKIKRKKNLKSIPNLYANMQFHMFNLLLLDDFKA